MDGQIKWEYFALTDTNLGSLLEHVNMLGPRYELFQVLFGQIWTAVIRHPVSEENETPP